MSIVAQGILGGFSGKTGPVIGSSWRGKPVMKAKPIFKKNRTFTVSQRNQQEKFKLMTSFLSSIDYLLNVSFKKTGKAKSGYQQAFAENLKNAILGEEIPFSVNYANVKLAHGSIPFLSAVTCQAETGNMVKLSWNLVADSSKKASEADRAIAVLYCEEMKMFITSDFTHRRSHQEILIDASSFSGKEVHSWFFFLSDNEAMASECRYTGAVTVNV